jgi:UDP-N-acetylglucosamine transferase subunit ALG13
MILVVIGNDIHPFNRLIKFIDEYYKYNSQKSIFIQKGYSDYTPVNTQYADFIALDKMKIMISNAEIIIGHGGTGILNMVLNAGKIPILVPRIVKLGEHRDPSQPLFCDLMEQKGLCTYLRELSFTSLEEAFRIVLNNRIIKKNASSSLEITLKEYLSKIE